jgi:hypothetical protein
MKYFYVIALFLTLGFAQSTFAQTGSNPCASPITSCYACAAYLTTQQADCTNNHTPSSCALCMLNIGAPGVGGYCNDCKNVPGTPEGLCDGGEQGDVIREAFCTTGKPVF